MADNYFKSERRVLSTRCRVKFVPISLKQSDTDWLLLSIEWNWQDLDKGVNVSTLRGPLIMPFVFPSSCGQWSNHHPLCLPFHCSTLLFMCASWLSFSLSLYSCMSTSMHMFPVRVCCVRERLAVMGSKRQAVIFFVHRTGQFGGKQLATAIVLFLYSILSLRSVT